MRTRPSPRSFGGGELAPWLDGITSEVTAKGCRTLENFIVMKQGPITRRPGTFYVNEVKTSANAHTVLVPVTINDDNSYVLEVGDAYIRFYKNHVQVSLTGSAYEVTSPWSTGDVTDLRWAYIPDEKAVYFTHPSYAMRKLAWTSDASWALATVELMAIPKMIIQEGAGRRMVSEDGLTWTRQLATISIADYAKDVAYGKDVYAVINATEDIDISDDGVTWVKATPGTGISPQGIAGNSYGQFVMVDSKSGKIFTSDDDGLEWTERTNVTTGGKKLHKVAYSYDDDGWRISGTSVGMYSKNGYTWVSITETALGQPYNLTYDNGLWVECTYEAGVGGRIYTSPSLTIAMSLAFSLVGQIICNIEYGGPSGAKLWVATTANGTIYKSNTGTIWSTVLTVTSAKYLYALKWMHNKFYLFGTGQDYWVSDTGLTWTSLTETVFPNGTNANAAYIGILSSDDNDLEWFDAADHYPKCISSHEGRLIMGPLTSKPSTLWGSKVGLLTQFCPGEFADEPWSYKISSERNVDIQWIMGGMGGLVVGTRTGEGVLMGSEAEGITPNTAQFRWQSTFGSDNVQPVRVHDHIIFAQRGGEIIRGFVPGAGAQAYKSPDLTQYADHIAEGGVHEFDHQDDPQTIVYAVRHDGTLLALTFETGAIAWSRIVTDGMFESVAVIPTSGAEDEVWAVVKRNIGAASSTVRYIEYFDTLKVASKNAAHFVDCGYENAACASATVFANVLTQLQGETVDVLVNGNIVEHGRVVTATGTLTITTPGATYIHAGLPCPAYAQTMRMETGSAWGAGMGLSQRNANLLAWVHDTMGGEYGPELSLTEAVAFTSASDLTTDLIEVNFPGTWDRDGYIWCIQRDPLPMTIVAVAPDIEVGDK
jgi:hypothetical protein